MFLKYGERMAKTTEFDLKNILNTIAIEGSNWFFNSRTRHLKVKCLNPKANIWAHIFRHTLLPTSDDADLDMDRGILVYCIMKGYKFDVGWIISDNIKTMGGRSNSKLPYPAIFHRLMAKA